MWKWWKQHLIKLQRYLIIIWMIKGKGITNAESLEKYVHTEWGKV